MSDKVERFQGGYQPILEKLEKGYQPGRRGYQPQAGLLDATNPPGGTQGGEGGVAESGAAGQGLSDQGQSGSADKG